MKPRVGITMGDPAGIGPEITVKALAFPHIYDTCTPVILGDACVIKNVIDCCEPGLKLNIITDVSEAVGKHGFIDILDYNDVDMSAFTYGEVNAKYGQSAVKYTKEAGKMCLEGALDAMVSAPLNKESMRLAGYTYEGQTQILGELCQSDNYGMLLVLDEILLLLFTTHMSLRNACNEVKYDKLLKSFKLAGEGVQLLSKENAVIAVSALNPHNGENGLFGDEEINEIIPAINTAQQEGVNIVGPIPADTIFTRAQNKEFDLVIALYHDQGNAALKLLGFGSIVTLLAGIPIIRTSTGHGTAFDIAGKNIADEKNIVKAIEFAAMLASKRVAVNT